MEKNNKYYIKLTDDGLEYYYSDLKYKNSAFNEFRNINNIKRAEAFDTLEHARAVFYNLDREYFIKNGFVYSDDLKLYISTSEGDIEGRLILIEWMKKDIKKGGNSRPSLYF